MTIDWWTLGLQTVNIAVLIWLLSRFFWRPVAAMIAQRRAAAQTSLDDAATAQDKAAAALADIAKTRAGFAAEREALLTAAREEADRAAKAAQAEAQAAAATRAEAAKAAIAQAKADAEKTWARNAETLATGMAARLAGRLEGAAIRAAFLDWLLEGIRAQPEAVRQATAAEGMRLEAITAMALDPAEQARCRDLIHAALGTTPEIAFTVDATLIAGFELHGPHLEVGNSWRADLARIRQDLAHAS